MNIHQKTIVFFEKTMKAYFKAVILSIKTYENILKFNFLISPPRPPPPIRDIDCLGKFYKAVIYRYKKQ